MKTSAINTKIIQYTIACIHEFARKYTLTPKEALNYLDRFKGLNFIDQFYDTEHLLSLEDAVSDLSIICQNNGGGIK